ncbi:MAG: hypothetical protein E7293_07215 [Lachnospiraceae bacterium]|nr:hypothetical protein [Lachnospiraceae bacterium]
MNRGACFILIAPFDIFGRGLYRYTFEGVCRECPDLKLQDGALRVFINTRGVNREDFTQEFLDLMEYITASTDAVAEQSNSQKLKRIHERVTSIKQSEKIGVKYMQTWEEKVLIREEGHSEGLREGLREGLKEGIKALIEACKSLGASWETARDMLMEKFSLCQAEAEEYLELHW